MKYLSFSLLFSNKSYRVLSNTFFCVHYKPIPCHFWPDTVFLSEYLYDILCVWLLCQKHFISRIYAICWIRNTQGSILNLLTYAKINWIKIARRKRFPFVSHCTAERYSCNKITTTWIQISRQNWTGFCSNASPNASHEIML